MAWRLMRYSMAAMQKHLESGHKELPLVFPILFYCGEKSPHPYSTDWLDCFSGRDIAEKIYAKPFKLVDVTTLEDGEIMQHRRMALLELIQKHIRRRDMSELLESILSANIVQQTGNATDKVMSQKSVTDALNSKQPNGDYATKTELTQGLNTKLNSSSVKQTTGSSTTEVMSQKACDEFYAKKKSQEELIAGGVSITYGNPTFTFKTTLDNSYARFELDPDKKILKIDNRNPDHTLKNSVTFPNKSGTLALTSDVDAINNYPVGAPIPWPQANPPEGYLVCNGDKIKCPKLALAYPSGRLPDLRGYFIRGWDAGRGVDPGRVLFSYQEDAIRNITGRIGYARQG